jgi:surface carbohydrate biosynthesis protein
VKKIFFFFKKVSLEIPKKNKYLYYDSQTLAVQKYLKLDHFEVLETRFNKINLFILLKTVFDFRYYDSLFFKNIKLFYLVKYIEYVNPKFVINFIDNDVRFYKLKKFFKKKTFISIQNGWRTEINDIFSKKEFLNDLKLSCDYYFVFNKHIGKKLSEKINSKFINFGSLKNNFYSISPIKKKSTVLYISQWSPNPEVIRYNGVNYDYAKISKNHEKILLNNIISYCNNYSLNFEILSKYEKKNLNFKKELKYYKNIILDKNWKFVPSQKNIMNKNNYNLIDSYNIIVTSWSTLGYEALARNKRTAFFSLKYKFNLKEKNFGWPYKLPQKGKFYSDNPSYNNVFNIFNYLTKTPNTSWLEQVNKYKKIVMSRHNGISLIKKILEKT